MPACLLVYLFTHTHTHTHARTHTHIHTHTCRAQDYPDYYLTVPEPESLSTVFDFVRSRRHSTDAADDAEFVTRLCTVFFNALVYNSDGSQVSRDAMVSA